MTRGRTAAACAVAGLLLTGCGGTDSQPGSEPGSTATAATTPTSSRTEVTLTGGQGSSVVRCWFPEARGRHRGRLVALVVPDSLQPARPTATSCSFADPDAPYRHVVTVSVGVTQSVADYRAESLDPYVVEDAGAAGDDAVLRVEEDGDATVFDGQRGAVVAFDRANDGAAGHTVLAQSGDLRVSWTVPLDDLADPSYDESEARDGIAGLQVVEDAREPG